MAHILGSFQFWLHSLLLALYLLSIDFETGSENSKWHREIQILWNVSFGRESCVDNETNLGEQFSSRKILWSLIVILPQPLLNSKPNIIVKGFSQNKVILLVQSLQKEDIDSKAKIIAKWKKEPQFLLSSMMLWVDRGRHQELTSLWPPIETNPNIKKK
jgi:hypothetical protein